MNVLGNHGNENYSVPEVPVNIRLQLFINARQDIVCGFPLKWQMSRATCSYQTTDPELFTQSNSSYMFRLKTVSDLSTKVAGEFHVIHSVLL